MEFLKMLEGIRTAFGDAFFLLVTMLGEEMLLIFVGLLFFWCVSKKNGYYILSVVFAGTVINQFLKLAFRIPRPWVRDPDFKAVEGAVAEATGYSFPSGHTQLSVGIYGGFVKIYKQRWFRVICIAACVLVPFSRMYLGVHTPADVLVSLAIALVLIFVLHPLMDKAFNNKRNMRIFFGIVIPVSAMFLIFVYAYKFPKDTDADNLASGMKNAYKILGSVIGLWFAYEIDEKYIKFDPKSIWWVHIIKVALGIIPLLLIKEGLKMPLDALFNGHFVAEGIRYFFITTYVGCVWPLTFKYFNKLSSR